MSNRYEDGVAIIAGQGIFPKILYEECNKKNIKCKIIGLKGEFDEKLFVGMQYDLFMPYNISSIFEHLKRINISNIVIAGKVGRKHLSKLILDKIGILIFKEIIKSGFNDNTIYSVIIKFIENNRFKIVPLELLVEKILSKKGKIGKVKINNQVKEDIKKGVEILKGIIKHDIGQALIINKGLILGVEAVEGTNNLLKRCAELRNEKEGGVLVKLCKPHQDRRLDLPCIGVTTIKNIAKYAYKGIVVEAKKSLILESNRTIKFANNSKIFIYGI